MLDIIIFRDMVFIYIGQFQSKENWNAPSGRVWKLKPEGGHEKILREIFGNDPLIMEASRLKLHHFLYNKETKYYPEVVIYCYDRVEKEK